MTLVQQASQDEPNENSCFGRSLCRLYDHLHLYIVLLKAQVCKSSEEAIQKCPNGMYSEVKYDGERVQVHKSGKQFKYYSRSLKPVVPHKVSGQY